MLYLVGVERFLRRVGDVCIGFNGVRYGWGSGGIYEGFFCWGVKGLCCFGMWKLGNSVKVIVEVCDVKIKNFFF